MSENKNKLVKTEITVGKLVDSANAFNTFFNQKYISGVTLSQIKRIGRQIKPHLEDYSESVDTIVEMLGEEGVISFSKKKAYKDEIKKLKDQVIDLELKKFNKLELRVTNNDEHWKTPSLMMDLDWLIIDEIEEEEIKAEKPEESTE